MSPHAVIYGVKGTALNEEERALFKAYPPFGYILFKRNCENPEQVRNLIRELKECINHENPPILIDQEGGRVARLTPPIWPEFPPAGYFREMAERDLLVAKEKCYENARLMGKVLKECHINANCAPVADLLFEGADNIIGDRAFGHDVTTVTELAAAMAEGLMDQGITPIVKHMPGHGRALIDSHKDLPYITTSKKELDKTDFKVFKNLSYLPWGMTAHIVYEAIDPELPATLSSKVINMIRNDIGFQGLLFTDDISMKALKGDVGELGLKSLEAGCDIVLHCNGDMREMISLAEKIPEIENSNLFTALSSHHQQKERSL